MYVSEYVCVSECMLNLCGDEGAFVSSSFPPLSLFYTWLPNSHCFICILANDFTAKAFIVFEHEQEGLCSPFG